MPEVWDQGACNSCAVHAVAAAWEFAARRSDHPPVTLSRLFIWYQGRVRENSVAEDTGIMIRTALKVLFSDGAPPEDVWPYNTAEYARQPSPEAYALAPQHKAQNYCFVKPARQHTLLDRLKAVLADGFPISFGFQHTAELDSQEVKRSGVLPTPNAGEHTAGDGHVALLVGYDDDTSMFKVRNSWGPEWGQQGYFTMPYGYVTSPWAGPEFWTVRLAA